MNKRGLVLVVFCFVLSLTIFTINLDADFGKVYILLNALGISSFTAVSMLPGDLNGLPDESFFLRGFY